MPLFAFDQMRKVKLQEKIAEPALSLAVVSDNSAGRIETPQISDDSVEVVKSRKTRPFNWILAASFAIVGIPLTAFVFMMATDPFARDFCLARLHRLCKDDRGAAELLSSALTIRSDDTALRERADCYSALKDRQRERADLWALVQHKTHEAFVYPRAAVAEARAGNISNAVSIYQMYADKERTKRNFKKQHFHKREEAAYNLLLMGELEQSKKLLKEISTPENEKSQTKKILESLIYREDGDRKRALESIVSVKEKYISMFKDSRMKYDQKAVTLSVQALLRLDDNEPKEARAILEQILPLAAKKKDNSEPILDVLKGWLLLEEGRLNECLALTESALKTSELDRSIAGLNLKAALHLIRRDVFQRWNQAEQAANEERLYAQTHCSGLLFEPMCLRKARPEMARP